MDHPRPHTFRRPSILLLMRLKDEGTRQWSALDADGSRLQKPARIGLRRARTLNSEMNHSTF